MGKDKKTTTEQTLDPATQKYVEDFLRPLGQQGADAALGGGPFFTGPTGTFTGAVEGLQGLQGQLGDFSKLLLSGGGIPEIGGSVGSVGGSVGQLDPNRAQDFFNPFESSVISGLQSDFDRQRQAAITRGAQEATGAGAFGGSRSGLLQAQGLADVNQNEALQLGNFRNQGFQNAQNIALSEFGTRETLGTQREIANAQNALQRAGLQQHGALAGLGLGLQGIGQQAGIGQQLLGAGDLERQINDQIAQEPLFRNQAGLEFGNLGLGPFGTNTSQTQQGSIWNDIAGVAQVGASFFNPFGGPAASQAFNPTFDPRLRTDPNLFGGSR